MRKIRECICFVVVILIVCCMSRVYAMDISATGSVSGVYVYDDEAFSGVGVKLYKIGSFDELGNLSFLTDFSSVEKDIYSMTNSEISEYAKELDEFVEENGVNCIGESSTGNDGKYSFDNVSVGLYLVSVDETQKGNNVYEVSPFLISVPNYNETNSEYDYDIVSNLKASVTVVSSGVPDGKNNEVGNASSEDVSDETNESSVKVRTSNSPGTYDGIFKYIIMNIIAVILFIIAVVYYKSLKRKEETDED